MENLKKQISIKIGERDILAISFAGLTLFSLVVATASYWSGRSCVRLAKGANATLVQQPDGTAFIANPKPANYRDPLVVKRFVGNWIEYAFTLSGELDISGQKKIDDRGIVAWGMRIPTNVISSAYAWSANKRKEFIEAYLTEGLVPEDYFTESSSTSTTIEVEIDSLGQAKLIDEKKQIFRVNVVATLSKHSNGTPTGEVDFYRKTITVASIPIPQKKPSANDSIYQQLSYQWRKEGLQIQEINPLSFKEY